ncbi:MAG: AAA family ATPase [Candidatus Heimdallarchaeota archaeon]|nr:MAG: AAA family ATPase [Candidatus Heimdallarchaeota archaeon]
MRLLIGITGLMGSGKSTVAAIIAEKYGFKRMRISGKMREIAQELELEVTRDFLQGIGKFMREFDDDVWVRFLCKKIQQSSQSIIVDDIRRMNEIEYLKPLGFKFIRVESSEPSRKARLEARGKKKISDHDWSRWKSHLTEIQVSQLPVDNIIRNEGTLEELINQIDLLMKELLASSSY